MLYVKMDLGGHQFGKILREDEIKHALTTQHSRASIVLVGTGSLQEGVPAGGGFQIHFKIQLILAENCCAPAYCLNADARF